MSGESEKRPASTERDGLRPELDENDTISFNSGTITPSHSGYEDIRGNIRSEITIEKEQEITDLARSYTRNSTYTIPKDGEVDNPFNSANPIFQPGNEKFNPKAWLKTIMHIKSRDPERYPNRTAGVLFKNMHVHGYGSAFDYQKDVSNLWMDSFTGLRKLFGGDPHKSETHIQILKDFDGLVKDGEMLAVLGRPGSGCSTFLKTIAGQTHGLYLDSETEIEYQGISRKMMQNNFRGEAIYNAETDVHFPHLTVGQTLSFAAQARAPRNRFPGITREQYSDHMRDVFMAVFGLTHTFNTKVGNDFVRGVSGGERKRVSIAEAALSGSPLQCWDNSTRGLDSATALEFVRTLRVQSELTGSTVLVSMYQASQNSYDVFDKVIVLYEGRQIYFGPTESAKAFFTDMGFACPDRQTTADFLTSLTSPGEREAKPGYENRVPRTPDEFADVWKKSDEYKRLMRDIDAYQQEFPLNGEQLEKFKQSRNAQQANRMSVNSPYTISVPMQIKLCIRRGFQRLQGDMNNFFNTVLGNIGLALIIASVFYNLPNDTSSFFLRGALLFFAVLMNAFSSILEILTLYAQRPIVEKHTQYALYHSYSESVASMICDLPAKILTSLGFNITIYFMANLRREPGAFFIFLLFSFGILLTTSMMFRTIASFSRTISQAMAPSAVLILVLCIYTGFAIPVGDMVVFLRWLNYLNPIAYAFESLMVNEFSGREFPCMTYIPSGPGYENATGFMHSCSTTGSIPGRATVNGDDYLNVTYSYYHSHLWRNFGILVAITLFFLGTYLYGSEMIAAARSKGEVLLFRKKFLKNRRQPSPDNEAASVPRTVVAENTANSGKSPAIHQQRDIFQWRDVCYDIQIKSETRRILDQVDGWVKPGTLTALMGVSGAGKTTLLDVLASRVTMGVVTGDMLVNGHPRDSSFQRKTGYVQQQDLHLQTSTVREALIFSACLRQPHTVSEKEKIEYVDEVIRMLEMEEYAEAIVGVPGEGLNVEQRKRLTIGVELAAKPELLLFLDEPTSGLDSQTAWSICTLMRKLTNSGQAILCTIHQPSALLVQNFDRLLFLAKGGKTVYFGEIGENASTLTGYFEKNGSHPCPPDANPAEWMLEVIGAAPGAIATKDWPQVWMDSPERVAVRKELDDMQRELSQNPPQSTGFDEFAMPFFYQFKLCLKRVAEQYWRTPTYIYSKIFLITSSALLNGLSFLNTENTMQGLQNQMFAVFLFLNIFGTIVQQIMPHFVTQRTLYEARERPSKAYSWKAFILSTIMIELPWQTLMAVLSFFLWYYPVGMYRNTYATDSTTERGALMFLLLWAFFMFASTFTHMMIAGVETAEEGGNFANLLFILAIIFCGVLATKESLPGFWIFMYRVSPFTYLIGGLLAVAVANTEVICSPTELTIFNPPDGQTCGTYMSDFIGFAGGTLRNPDATADCQFCVIADTNRFLSALSIDYNERWRNFGLVMVYAVFNLGMAVFIYWLARVPKNKKKAVKSKTQ